MQILDYSDSIEAWHNRVSYMDKTETSLMQKTQSLPEAEADNDRCEENNLGSDPGQTSNDIVDAGHVSKKILPFCFVKIWPKEADSMNRIKEAVRLFEMVQEHFQISEKIKEKVFDRERVLSRLENLKNYYSNRLNGRVDCKKGMLKNLYLELDKFSFPNNAYKGRTLELSRTEEEVDNHKLNFWMLHRSKNLAEEKKTLKGNKLRQQRAVSTSPVDAYPHKNHNQKNCERLYEEIPKKSEAAKRKTSSSATMRGKVLNSKITKDSVRNTVKAICDELMEMRKEKKALETKIRSAEKDFEAINEEIWSFQTHLKEKHKRKEASVCILYEMKIDDYWVLQYGNLEHDSTRRCTIYCEKS